MPGPGWLVHPVVPEDGRCAATLACTGGRACRKPVPASISTNFRRVLPGAYLCGHPAGCLTVQHGACRAGLPAPGDRAHAANACTGENDRLNQNGAHGNAGLQCGARQRAAGLPRNPGPDHPGAGKRFAASGRIFSYRKFCHHYIALKRLSMGCGGCTLGA